MKHYFFGIIAVAILLGAGCSKEVVPVTPDGEEQIDVPFTSQAPEGNWSEPWQNACEETSIVMIDAFFEGGELTKEEAKKRIQAIFDEKRATVGDSFDESMNTIATIIEEADLGWSVELVEDPSLEDMKGYLEAGYPLIVPVYARELSNPYYGGAGPDYHVMIVSGYDDEKGVFITKDPGTSHGDNLSFSYDELYGAIHDYLGTDDYTSGPRRILVAKPDTE